MGLLVDGVWHDKWYDTKASDGRFVRSESQFRDQLTPAQVSADARLHLYVSLACPWASRTLIFRKLKGLEARISFSVVHPDMLENGWTFEKDNSATGDELYGLDYLYQIYLKAASDYSGRVTVPVLWDKESKTIVNNESAEIIRMFNSSFNEVTGNALDFYPESLRAEIDDWNERIYSSINNGVYRAGFATTQEAYEEAFDQLFVALDELDVHFAKNRFLCGSVLTEADWRLFVTLIRFDAVYVGHFKCNLRRLEDYLHIPAYVRDLYQYPGIAETVNMTHIKQHYYVSQRTINPTQVVPKGPLLDFGAPHGRERLGELVIHEA
jgi:putative glutathione S-transferase